MGLSIFFIFLCFRSFSSAATIERLPVSIVRSYSVNVNHTVFITPQIDPLSPPATLRVAFYLQSKSNDPTLMCNGYVGNGYTPSSQKSDYSFLDLQKAQEAETFVPYYSAGPPLPLWIVSIEAADATSTNHSRCVVSVYFFGTCNQNCNNQGMCDAREGTCHCNDNYYGYYCQYSKTVVNPIYKYSADERWMIAVSVIISFVVGAGLFFLIGRWYGIRRAYTLE